MLQGHCRPLLCSVHLQVPVLQQLDYDQRLEVAKEARLLTSFTEAFLLLWPQQRPRCIASAKEDPVHCLRRVGHSKQPAEGAPNSFQELLICQRACRAYYLFWNVLHLQHATCDMPSLLFPLPRNLGLPSVLRGAEGNRAEMCGSSIYSPQCTWVASSDSLVTWQGVVGRYEADVTASPTSVAEDKTVACI